MKTNIICCKQKHDVQTCRNSKQGRLFVYSGRRRIWRRLVWDRFDDLKKVAKKVQKSDTVRNLEKGALDVGAKALRGAVETGLDGVADSALQSFRGPA